MRTLLALVCLLLSGAAGLLDEICWIRAASLQLGCTTYALGAVLAVFFAGLALGSSWFGAYSLRARQPLRTYARVELSIAVLAVVSLPLLRALTAIYGVIYRATSGNPAAAFLARSAILAAVIFPAAFLMGGTLPLFCRQYSQHRGRIGRAVGGLYAVNTLGAALGCAAGGLVLIPAIGMQATLGVAAGLSVLCAGLGLLLARAAAAPPRPSAQPRGAGIAGAGMASAARPLSAASRMAPAPGSAAPLRAVDPGVQRLLWVLAAIAGLVALGQEVIWTRQLALLVRSTIVTATLTLTAVLLGIVVGGAIAAAGSDRLSSTARARSLGALLVAVGLAIAVLTQLPPDVWSRAGGDRIRQFALLLPTAVLSGACFPLLARMLVVDPAGTGAAVGRLAAANTAGGIAGSLLVAFIVLPRLGLRGSAALTSGLSVAAGATAWLALEPGAPRRRWLWVAGACAAWLAVPLSLRTRIPQDFLAERGALVDFREGRESNLALVRREQALVMEIDRWWQGEDRPTHQIVAAHLPALLHPNARRALVVGVGAGQTPSRFVWYPLERLDCIDIEPAVFDLIAGHFDARWMADPRVRLLREDGRNYLLHSAERYELISLEVGQLSRPGVASFYTQECYRAVARRLDSRGMAAQFVPTAFLTPAAFRSVVATFLTVFPNSMLWYNTSELLLLGCKERALRVDLDALTQRLAQPAVAADLRYAYWGGAAERLNRPWVLLGGYLCGPDELAALASDAPILRDDRPRLEQAACSADEQQALELPIVELLRAHLAPLTGLLDRATSATTDPAERAAAAAPPESLTMAATVRASNLGDMVASALLRRVGPLRERGATAEVRALVAQALQANPRNAEAQRLMGEVELFSGNVTGALAWLQQALRLRPDDARAWRAQGLALQHAGELPAAQESLRHALELWPGDAETQNSMGALLASQGQLAQSVEHFEAAVRLQPDYVQAQKNLAQARALLGAGALPRAPRAGGH